MHVSYFILVKIWAWETLILLVYQGRVVEIYGLEASVTSALKIWILFVAVLFVLWKSGFMFSDYE